MTTEAVVYPVSGGATGVPFEDVTLTPPSQYGFTKWRGVIVANYSGGIAQARNAGDEPTNTPGLLPFTEDYYDFTNARGPIVVHWLNTGLTPLGGAAVIATFSDDPQSDFGGKVFPGALPVATLSATAVAPSLEGLPMTFSSNTNSAAFPVTFTVSVPNGAMLALFMGTNGGAITGVSSVDGAWTALTTNPGSETVGWWYLTGASGGSTYTITVAGSGFNFNYQTILYVIANAGTVTAGPAEGPSSATTAGAPNITIPFNSMCLSAVLLTELITPAVFNSPPSPWVVTNELAATANTVALFAAETVNAGLSETLPCQWANNGAPGDGPFGENWSGLSMLIAGP